MKTHHFIGIGRLSQALQELASSPSDLSREVASRVTACGFEVVSQHRAPFDQGGMTLVWVLAESHLVLHIWSQEGFATLDLHLCDYRHSNAGKAQMLSAELTELCFAPATARWQEMHLEPPGVS